MGDDCEVYRPGIHCAGYEAEPRLSRSRRSRTELLLRGPSNPSSGASQSIDVSSEAAAIDAGNSTYEISGYLGGWQDQDDNAVLKITFKNADGEEVGTDSIGPVTAADRGNVTGMLPRSANGSVPAGTRRIDVLLQMTRTGGSNNDGYADNLSLVLDFAVPKPTRTPLILVPGIGGSKLEYAEDVPMYDSEGNIAGYEHRAGDEKWPRIGATGLSPLDGHLKDLRLASDGEQPYSNASKYASEVGDIWREATAFGETFDQYQATLDTLTNEYGYEEGEDLFVFPYDWRKDIGARTYENGSAQSEKLLEKIDDVLSGTGSSKANILAHSQGGLVTLAALRDPESSGKVDKVMTLGTPVLGATQSLAVFNQTNVSEDNVENPGLHNEIACFGERFRLSLDGCAIYGGISRTLFQNFPGAYQLFPSRAFHQAEGSPVRVASDPQAGPGTSEKDYDYEVRDLSYEEWSADVKKGGNAGLIDEADTFHSRYDDLASEPLVDPSVDLVRVVGAGLSTPDYILETNRFCGGNGPCSYTELRYTREGNIEGGDGTVPIHSADLYNPDSESDFDLRNGVPNVYAWAVEHGELQKDSDILEMANSYFNEDSVDNVSNQADAEDGQPISLALMDFLGMRTAQAQSDDDQDIAELARQSGLYMQPTSFSGVELQTIGSVQGRVEDTDGNVLGTLPDQERGQLPEGFIVEEIEGGDYSRIGDNPTQSFFLNETGAYTGTLTVEQQDELEIRVRTYGEGKTTGAAIFYLNRLIGGKLPQGARIQLAFQSGGDPGTLRLRIDEDADGITDRQLAPYSVISGAQTSDQTPPTTTATTRVVEPERGSRPRPTQARVALAAQDGLDGSGIGAIYYRLEGEQQLRLYKEPFIVPLNTTIYYGAVDKAGNASLLQKLLVDDAPDNLRTAEPITTKDRIKRYIDPEGDRDWFSFEADGTSAYTVQLYGLPEDYNLGVYDQSGKEVAASPRRKKKSEKVTVKPSAGRYYIRVVGYDGAWSEKLPYHLKAGERTGGVQDGG